MDVNGTKFHVLQGRRDWERVISETPLPAEMPARFPTAPDDRGIAWDSDFGGISLLRRVPLLSAAATSRPTSLSRGAASDQFQNVFWLNDDGTELWVQPRGSRRAGKYFAVSELSRPEVPAPHGPFVSVATGAPPQLARARLRGLCVTSVHYLVVGLQEPGGLLIFDLDAGGPPSVWQWPVALRLRPWLLSATPDGGVCLVDFDESTHQGRVWQLDRTLTPTDSRPAGAGAQLPPGTPLELERPVALACLADGSTLLLDAGAPAAPGRLLWLRSGRLASSVLLDAALTAPALDTALTEASSLAVIDDEPSSTARLTGRAYVTTAGYAQVFELAFVLDGAELTFELLARALPTSGGAAALVRAGNELLFQANNGWFPLEEQPRYRYLTEVTLGRQSAPGDGALVFDGKEAGCVWHRVIADACVPAGCEVRLRARTADDRGRLAEGAWISQPSLQRRSDGSDLPYEQPFGASAADSQHLGSFETLLMTAEGRYLQLELTLLGDGRASPKLRALRVYYPRFSYLKQYLPAIYRQDPAAADFLDRFLANPEGMLSCIEGRIASAETVLDAATAPSTYLDWLGGWLDALLDPSWDEPRKRLFLKFAWLLYKWRGSARGLLAFVRLATEDCPEASIFDALQEHEPACAKCTGAGFGLRIVEDFERRRYAATFLGDPTSASAGLASGAGTWRRSDGGGQLHVLFRAWLARRRPNLLDASLAELTFSPVPPSNVSERADWQDFVSETFDFTYSAVSAAELGVWQEFLARRYASIGALNQAHGRSSSNAWAAFAAVPLPREQQLPSDGAPLDDWLDFVALALPIRRNAHRFTVLVPTRADEAPALRAQRLQRVEVVVRAEKPAHTSFEVRPFWALFQVGGARVGLDTVLGESSRFLPLVLDAGYLRDGYLAAAHPFTESDRRVIGRDDPQGN